MKKIIFLLFLVALTLIFYSSNSNDSIPVFNDTDYIDNYDHDYFYVSSKKVNLNSNNLEFYFDKNDIKIVGIYPTLDKIFEDSIKKKLNYYSFSYLYNNRANINNFTNNYVSILKNNNYIDLANTVYFDGINIEKVLIYTSYNQLYLHDLEFGVFDYKIKDF